MWLLCFVGDMQRWKTTITLSVNCSCLPVTWWFQQVSFIEKNRIVSVYSNSHIFIFIVYIDRSGTANSSKYKSSVQWQTIGFYGFFAIQSLVSCQWDGNFCLSTTFVWVEICQQLLNEQPWNTEQTVMFHSDFGDPLYFPLAQWWFKVNDSNSGMGCHEICHDIFHLLLSSITLWFLSK